MAMVLRAVNRFGLRGVSVGRNRSKLQRSAEGILDQSVQGFPIPPGLFLGEGQDLFVNAYDRLHGGTMESSRLSVNLDRHAFTAC